MRMLIVMPSKQRPYTLKTTQWLLKCDLPEGVDFKCFCEPQEAIHYRATLGRRNVAVLDRNDMGLGYALQYAHRYAAERGYDLSRGASTSTRTWRRSTCSGTKARGAAT